MPSKPLNRRGFEAAADGHSENNGKVAVFNGCNAALGQTGAPGQYLSHRSLNAACPEQPLHNALVGFIQFDLLQLNSGGLLLVCSL